MLRLDKVRNKISKIYNLRNMIRFSTTHSIQKESVAEHSYFVTMIALFLSAELNSGRRPINVTKILIMALLHDVPEYKISDIPANSKEVLQIDKIIKAAELGVMSKYLDRKLFTTFQEYCDKNSIESKIVDLADKIEVEIFSNNEIKLGNSIFKEIKQMTKKLVETKYQKLIVEFNNYEQ